MVSEEPQRIVMGDRSLVESCRAGDDRAWRLLVDRYVRLVYSIPLNFGLSPTDADDVTQSTFAILMGSLSSIENEDRLGAWLATVARRQTFRHVERLRREAPTDDPAVPVGEDAAAIRRTEDMEWLHQGLSRLDDRCTRLLLALYFTPEARPYTEVAAELGLPVGSIGPTRGRCLDKLRAILADLDQV